MKKWLTAVNDKLLGAYGIIAFFLLWEMAPRLGWADPQFIPTLSKVLLVGWKLAISGDLYIHISASIWRYLVSMLLALILAIPLGFLMGGWFPGLVRFFDPLFKFLSHVHAFNLFPIFILFFGIGEPAKISIIFWSCLWPILFTTIDGVRQVNPTYLKIARSMGANRATLYIRVILPGSLPSIITGIRLGSSMALLMLIAGEMTGGSAGLGYLLNKHQKFTAMLTIAFLGWAINYLFNWLENNIVNWKEESANPA